MERIDYFWHLQLDIDQRFSSAAEMCQALKSVVVDNKSKVTPVRQPKVRLPKTRVFKASKFAPSTKKKLIIVWIAIVIVLIILVVIICLEETSGPYTSVNPLVALYSSFLGC
jgi:t-SNARE complex subunit (syntaxin)